MLAMITGSNTPQIISQRPGTVRVGYGKVRLQAEKQAVLKLTGGKLVSLEDQVGVQRSLKCDGMHIMHTTRFRPNEGPERMAQG